MLFGAKVRRRSATGWVLMHLSIPTYSVEQAREVLDYLSNVETDTIDALYCDFFDQYVSDRIETTIFDSLSEHVSIDDIMLEAGVSPPLFFYDVMIDFRITTSRFKPKGGGFSCCCND